MLTYGFYDSINHDRRYNAIQMSSIFDGVINDGIFMSIGERFNISASGNDMTVTVGTGRAWFNHTWTLNDSILLLELPPSELILNRYDAVVLEVNSEVSVRANEIKIVSGTPSSNPVYPTMINTKSVHQHPLAYIYVGKNVTAIRQADITSMIGKGDAPYVTGIIDTIDIEDMVAQWEDQWKKFFEMQTEDMTTTNANWKEQWRTWFSEYTAEMDETSKRWKDLWHQWYHMYTDSSSEEFGNWKNQQKAEFIEWFNSLKDMLTEQVEAMMAAEIEALKKRTTALEKFEDDLSNDQAIYQTIDDSNGDPITDNTGDPIGGRTLFVTANSAIDFVSEDGLNPSRYQELELIKTGSLLGDLMTYLSVAVKNTRYLFKQSIYLGKKLLGIRDRVSVLEKDFKNIFNCDVENPILDRTITGPTSMEIPNAGDYDALYIVVRGDVYNGIGVFAIPGLDIPISVTTQSTAAAYHFSITGRYYHVGALYLNRVEISGWLNLFCYVYGINFGKKGD